MCDSAMVYQFQLLAGREEMSTCLLVGFFIGGGGGVPSPLLIPLEISLGKTTFT